MDNYMITGDDGSHHFSPFFRGEKRVEKEKCEICYEPFDEEELTIVKYNGIDISMCKECKLNHEEYEV